MAGMSRVHLNYSRTWAEVGAIVTAREGNHETGKPIGWVRDAFKNGIADKVHLTPGKKLYKFNDYPCLVPPASNFLGQEALLCSPWWSSYDRYDHEWSKESGLRGLTVDHGWNERKKMAAMFGVSLREWGRITSVVKENWNALKYLLVITLKVNANAWFGQFASMGRIDPGSTSKRFGNEGRAVARSDMAPVKFTSVGMQERLKKYGSGGTLAGGATQYYLPNLRAMHVASWSIEDLSKL